ncbi:MAG: rod shape-determining protein RodA [Bryobacteraceae bacterium]|jgi:rod shape determining protein RodA|nr:rod shape-determining protein RodA [Bryobacteraceae bacterium]
MAGYRSFRDFDWALIILAVAICGLGILQIYSATLDTAFRTAWWRQIVWMAVGLVVMWFSSRIDYHTLMGQVPILYGLTILLLVLTPLFGRFVWGSKRWIPVAFGFHFQPSEFAKLVIILLVARYLSEMNKDRLDLRDVLRLAGLVGLPCALVLAQPDLGTSLTYIPVVVTGLFLGGIRWQHAAAIIALAVVLAPVSYFLMKPYQKARIESFFDPQKDPTGRGYQVIQSKIAVGAGGMWGAGVTQGSQTQLRFLPIAHTDFLISAFAEEHGFVGVLVLLGLYFLLLMQIVQNAQTAPDRAGMFVCMGVCSILLFHVLVNAGMAVGRMPVAGIPLPLMSYGGSSMISFFMMLGLVHNVRLRRFVS